MKFEFEHKLLNCIELKVQVDVYPPKRFFGIDEDDGLNVDLVVTHEGKYINPSHIITEECKRKKYEDLKEQLEREALGIYYSRKS